MDDSQVQKGTDVLDQVVQNRNGMQSSLARYMRSEKLRELPLFEGLNSKFVSRVIADVDFACFKPGDTILQQGDKASSCYILYRGEVSVVVGGTQVAKLGDGSIFGEICLLGLSQYRTASIVAVSFCDVRVVHKDKFQFALSKFPDVREHFRKEAERRMAATVEKNPEVAPASPKSARRSYFKSAAHRKRLSSGINSEGKPVRRRSQGDLPLTDDSECVVQSCLGQEALQLTSHSADTVSTKDKKEYARLYPTLPAKNQEQSVIDSVLAPTSNTLYLNSARHRSTGSAALSAPNAQLPHCCRSTGSDVVLSTTSSQEIPSDASRTVALDNFLACADLMRISTGSFEDFGFTEGSQPVLPTHSKIATMKESVYLDFGRRRSTGSIVAALPDHCFW